ncbi:hypothetical protein [Leucothrix arctica]|uniref:Uncharacterized protein n=1 Tax=Leucothrix arctica TaxID=1481894 RepID=A0A317CAN1_9GAMM|nr:hypothetical protein [Leucothrix arctica]PWQ93430.1 hypothetical protein DKT75_17525 [Leucothrix arctica]
MNQRELPTSVNVTSWTFMILGGLAILSGIFHSYVALYYEQVDGIFDVYPGILQVIIALGVAILGYKLRCGGKQTPKLVITICILLALVFIVFGVVQSVEWGTSMPLVSTVLYLIPLACIGKAFMSEKVNAYYTKGAA